MLWYGWPFIIGSMTSTGSLTSDVGSKHARAGSTKGGPDWYDINVLLVGLERTSGRRLRLEMQPVTGVAGRWGFRVYIRVVGCETILGESGFGPAYPSGARSLAGAAYNAIYRSTDQLESDVHDSYDLRDS